MSYPRAELRRARRLPAYAAVSLGAVVADVVFDPVHRHVPLCPLHAATGLSCPLCGSLRAVDEIAHGRVVAALHYNALLVATAVVLGLGFVARRDWLTGLRRSRVALVGALAVAVAFTVLRNAPWGAALRG